MYHRIMQPLINPDKKDGVNENYLYFSLKQYLSFIAPG